MKTNLLKYWQVTYQKLATTWANRRNPLDSLPPISGGVRNLVIYCQSAFGVGHFVRISRIVNEIQESNPDLTITLIYGGPSIPWVSIHPSVRIINLEPIWFSDAMKYLISGSGEDPNLVLKSRKKIIIELLAAIKPQAIIFEHFPFGRWPFRKEILPMIEYCWRQRPRPVLISSVRDICYLKRNHASMVYDAVSKFDKVFVHSDPSVQPFVVGELDLNKFASKVEYTGYVTPAISRSQAKIRNQVLVHTGGGRDGKELWETLSELESTRRNVTFIKCGERWETQVQQNELLDMIASSSRCICMAGYNSVAEWLKLLTPTIFVPRTTDSEQLTRVENIQTRLGGPMQIARPSKESLIQALSALDEKAACRFEVMTNGQRVVAEYLALL